MLLLLLLLRTIIMTSNVRRARAPRSNGLPFDLSSTTEHVVLFILYYIIVFVFAKTAIFFLQKFYTYMQVYIRPADARLEQWVMPRLGVTFRTF